MAAEHDKNLEIATKIDKKYELNVPAFTLSKELKQKYEAYSKKLPRYYHKFPSGKLENIKHYSPHDLLDVLFTNDYGKKVRFKKIEDRITEISSLLDIHVLTFKHIEAILVELKRESEQHTELSLILKRERDRFFEVDRRLDYLENSLEKDRVKNNISLENSNDKNANTNKRIGTDTHGRSRSRGRSRSQKKPQTHKRPQSKKNQKSKFLKNYNNSYRLEFSDDGTDELLDSIKRNHLNKTVQKHLNKTVQKKRKDKVMNNITKKNTHNP